MRTIIAITIWFVLEASSAAWAQDCRSPITSVQMTRGRAGLDLIPVGINGLPRKFLFDTGGAWTSVSKNLAAELNLPVERSNRRMRDISGNVSSDKTQVREIQVGQIRVPDSWLPVISPLREDGLYAPDHYRKQYDLEVDFGTDRLTYFPQCPGSARNRASGAAVALDPDGLPRNKLVVPVTLDGLHMDAVLDTGASRSMLRADIARQIFGVMPGEPGTPRTGVANGDSRLPIYSHRFKSLSFADVTLASPRLAILSDASGPITDQFEGPVHAPLMILGMDVLRKMRLYFAFSEMKIYVSPASPTPLPPGP